MNDAQRNGINLVRKNSSWIMIALLVVANGESFFSLKEIGDAVNEIHELHKELFASVDRQKAMKELLDKLNKQ